MPRDTEYCDGDLPTGTLLLRNQYRIERRLIDGGFGITYVARDSLDRRVVIKECYPCGISCREDNHVKPSSAEFGELYSSILHQFQCEAQRLAALTHPNIVSVHQIFEENGTAYMAMDFVDGTDLTTIAETDPERFQPELFQHTLNQALEAIRYIHGQGVLHRDIAPDNFLLDAKGHLTLIDFGAAFDEHGDRAVSQSQLLSVKDGFSPHEFYANDRFQDASSDLYALGATLYYLITGTPPPNGQERFAAVDAGKPDPYQCLTDGNWAYKPSLLASIDRALEVLQKDRISSASEWLVQLNSNTGTGPDIQAAKPKPTVNISEEAIVQLVNDTNMKITPTLPGVRSRQQNVDKHAVAPKNVPAEAKPWVDIFGNPIKDVDAFLREQDSCAKTRLPGRRGNKALGGSRLIVQIPPSGVEKDLSIPRFSLLGKLLGRRAGSTKRPSSSAIVQT